MTLFWVGETLLPTLLCNSLVEVGAAPDWDTVCGVCPLGVAPCLYCTPYPIFGRGNGGTRILLSFLKALLGLYRPFSLSGEWLLFLSCSMPPSLDFKMMGFLSCFAWATNRSSCCFVCRNRASWVRVTSFRVSGLSTGGGGAMGGGARTPGKVVVSSVLSSIWWAGLLATSSLCSCSDSST